MASNELELMRKRSRGELVASSYSDTGTPISGMEAFGEGLVSGLSIGYKKPSAQARMRYKGATTAGEVLGGLLPVLATTATGGLAGTGVATLTGIAKKTAAARLLQAVGVTAAGGGLGYSRPSESQKERLTNARIEAAMFGTFEAAGPLAKLFIPKAAPEAARIAAEVAVVGGGSTGIEIAAGADPEDAKKSGLIMGLTHGVFRTATNAIGSRKIKEKTGWEERSARDKAESAAKETIEAVKEEKAIINNKSEDFFEELDKIAKQGDEKIARVKEEPPVLEESIIPKPEEVKYGEPERGVTTKAGSELEKALLEKEGIREGKIEPDNIRSETQTGLETEPRKVDLKVEKPTEEISFAKVEDKNINEVITDPKRFQGRLEEYSEESVKRMMEDWDKHGFDPVTIWKDPKTNKWVALNHSRMVALQEYSKLGLLPENKAPFKIFEGTEKEAQKWAIEQSNRFATKEGLRADIRTYRRMVDRGATKDELKRAFGNDQANTLNAYSNLNPEGGWVRQIGAGSEAFPDIQAWSRRVGLAKKKYGLTDSHETELFDFFYRDAKAPSNRQMGAMKFNDLLSERTGSMFWDKERPLDLANALKKTGSSETIRAQEAANEIKTEIRDLKSTLQKLEDKSGEEFLLAKKELRSRIKQKEEELSIIDLFDTPQPTDGVYVSMFGAAELDKALERITAAVKETKMYQSLSSSIKQQLKSAKINTVNFGKRLAEYVTGSWKNLTTAMKTALQKAHSWLQEKGVYEALKPKNRPGYIELPGRKPGKPAITQLHGRWSNMYTHEQLRTEAIESGVIKESLSELNQEGLAILNQRLAQKETAEIGLRENVARIKEAMQGPLKWTPDKFQEYSEARFSKPNLKQLTPEELNVARKDLESFAIADAEAENARVYNEFIRKAKRKPYIPTGMENASEMSQDFYRRRLLAGETKEQVTFWAMNNGVKDPYNMSAGQVKRLKKILYKEKTTSIKVQSGHGDAEITEMIKSEVPEGQSTWVPHFTLVDYTRGAYNVFQKIDEMLPGAFEHWKRWVTESVKRDHFVNNEMQAIKPMIKDVTGLLGRKEARAEFGRITEWLEGVEGIQLSEPGEILAQHLRNSYRRLYDYFEVGERAGYVDMYSPRIAKEQSFGAIDKYSSNFEPGTPEYHEASIFKKRTGDLFDRETDAVKLFQYYVSQGSKSKFFSPLLDNMAPMINRKMGNSSSQGFAANYMNSWVERQLGIPSKLDVLLNESVQNIYGMVTGGKKLPDRLSQNMARFLTDISYSGTLGFRPDAAVRNLTQTNLTMAEIGPKAVLDGVVLLKRNGFAELKERGVIRQFIPDATVSETAIKPFMEQIRDTSMFLFQQADQINRGIAYYGSRSKFMQAVAKHGGEHLIISNEFMRDAGILKMKPAIKRNLLANLKAGKAWEAANDYAYDVTARTQYVYTKEGSPLITRSAVGRTFFQYKTWFTNYADLITGWTQNKNYEAITRWLLGTATLIGGGKVVGLDLGPWIGMSPFPVQRDRYGNFMIANPPVMQAVINSVTAPVALAKAAQEELSGKRGATNKELKSLSKQAWNLGITFVPGGLEMKNIARTLKEDDYSDTQKLLKLSGAPIGKPK